MTGTSGEIEVPEPKRYYLVVACTHCSRFLLARSDSRSRLCPYCGRRVRLSDAKIIARSEKAKNARLALQKTKTMQGDDKAGE